MADERLAKVTEIIENSEILKKLDDGRIFSLYGTPEGKLNFWDSVDACFEVEISKDEVLQLADVFKQLAELI